MEFPITDLLDKENCTNWIIEYFHPNGFGCPLCNTDICKARTFRTTKHSQLIVYRCHQCDHAFNLYSGTVFPQCHLTPMQVVLMVRGVVKGEPSLTLSAELDINYQTVLRLRHKL